MSTILQSNFNYLHLFAAFFFGGLFGMLVMCILFISRSVDEHLNDLESDELNESDDDKQISLPLHSTNG